MRGTFWEGQPFASPEEALEHAVKHDLIFFEKRSTPKVVRQGMPFTAPKSYGKQTRRRAATPEEEKQIAKGVWVRVDQSGKKGGQPGYKKTRMPGREHLVKHDDILEHYGIKGMRWGIRKKEERKALIENFGPTKVVATTSDGTKLTLERDKPQKVGFKTKRQQELIRKTSQMAIKDKDGKTIGDLQLWKESKDEINVTWVDIETSQRGRGYASAVMRSVEEIGRSQGVKKLTLEVPGISPDARHIYEKQGFKVVKTPKSTKDVWGGLTHMEKRLD